MAKKPAKPGPLVKTIAEVAERLGVDATTVKNWFAGGCPKQRGKYDVDAIAAWRAAHKKPRQPTSDEGERAKWERRKVRAEAKIKELALRAKRGELIEVSRAGQVMTQHVAEVVTHLDQLPESAVAGVPLPAEVKERIKRRLKAKIREMRIAFEKSLREMARTARRDGEASDE